MTSHTGLAAVRSELVLGGQRSGKSRRAEALAEAWLGASPAHRTVFIATALPGDGEMRARIDRHRSDRALRLPAAVTVEEPLHLAESIAAHGRPGTLLVVDCLTLWLTNRLFPPPGAEAENGRIEASDRPSAQVASGYIATLLIAIEQSAGPLVLVSNEIGLGVVPIGREVRAFVDALGLLNQQAAAACRRVTLMAAGLPLTLKDAAP